MALWRGEPLEDLPASSAWEADLTRLGEGRLAPAEERLALLVELGKHTTAISEAQLLLHANPYRERVWQHLMLALHRSGRRAEALRALGVTGTAIPKSLSERAALYRTRLADRRVLVVLDDAANAAQVSPLLPTTAGCAVIVTSRHRLAELPGAHPVVLDALRPAEARELMERIVGRERTGREPRETAAILRACGYLPLAIRIAGAKLAGRRAWTLGVLRERLADESQRISELQAGGLGVRASFEMSMRMLPADAARAFRLLGVLGAQTFPGWVIDALLDRGFAGGALDALLDAHLLDLADVDATGRPRYRLHDLLRAYAREAAAGDPPQVRRAALTRVLGGWLALAEQAADRLPATVNRAAPGSAPRRRLDPNVAAQLVADPRAWFEAERHSLLAAVRLAADGGMDELAWELAACLVPYLDHLGLFEDWRRGHEQALPAVRAAGNRRGEAVLLRGLGQVNLYWDDFERARRDFDRSRELSQEIGDRRGEAWALSGLATIGRILGRHGEALGQCLDVLAAFAVTGDRHLEAQTRNSIGMVRLAQGHLEDARTWFSEALRIAEDIGDEFRAALVLVNMGELHRTGDAPLRALACQRQALTTLERIGDEHSVAYALLAIGETFAALEDWTNAEAASRRARTIFTRIGDHGGETACARLLDKVASAASRCGR
jgi:tetratricopeptide (TPR) repeat protein